MTNPRLLLLILLPVLVLLHASVATAKENDAIPAFAKQLSLLFIENKGQVTDQHNNPRNDIDAKLQTPGVTVFIGNGQLHYQWAKQTSPQTSPKETDFNSKFFDSQVNSPLERKGEVISTYRMDVTLVGANTNAELVKEDVDDYYENYYTPQTGEKGMVAHAYRKLTYKDVYPNIDWVLYVAAGDKVKYDFIVHPGGNPGDIQIRYDGATELKLHDGALTATTTYGSITENAPYTYSLETKQQVASSFVLEGNTLSFNTEKHEGTLVIDPQLHWATYYGGSHFDASSAVCTDDSNYVYTCGTTRSTNNIATSGSFLSTLGTNYYNGFIAKFNDKGKRLWGTYYHNAANTALASMIFDDALFVLGESESTTATMSSGSHQQIYGGGSSDCILLKFSSSGNLLWGTYIGGTGKENATDIVRAPNHEMYIIGLTISSNGIVTAGAYQSNLPANQFGSSFVMKFSANGLRIWGTYFGNNALSQNDEYINAGCTDRWGNLYLVGATGDTANIATAGAHQFKKSAHSIGGWSDGYLVKFDSSGKKIWGTYYGGTGEDHIWDVDCDTSGNIFFVGGTSSPDSISTPGAFQVSHSGSWANNFHDGFVVKFDSSGKRLWGTYYGNNNNSSGLVVLISGKNGIVNVGGYGSGSGLATNDAHQLKSQGGIEMLIAQFTSAGSRLWASYFGGPSNDWFGRSMALSRNNNLYFGGYTQSKTGIVTANAHQYYYIGGPTGYDFDGFLAKFTADTFVCIDKLLPDTACVGDILPVYYRTTYPFKTNNKFTVQLSNASGSFANPITIGTKNGLATDTVHCLIPMNTPPGTGYRIRVMGSLKADTSLESMDTIVINNVFPTNVTAVYNGPLCPYDTLKLSGSSTTAGVKYAWTGPSGFSAVIANPIVDTASKHGAGKYIVHANLYGCIGKDTVEVVLKTLPYATALDATATVPCIADTLYLNIPAGATNTTYAWTGPNSFTSTLRNPYIENASTSLFGNYIVTVTLDGCSQKDTATLSAIKPIPAKPDATNNGPLCAGANMQFNATTTTPGVTWKWAGPNSFTTTTQNPFILSVQPIHSGDYIVTATLNGCHARDTVAAVINIIPVKPVITANATLCEKDTLRFNGSTTTTGVTYSWTGPQSFAGSVGDTAFEVAGTIASGQYTLTVSKDGCSNNESVTVLVKPLPATVTVGNSGPICEQNNLQLSCGTSTTGSTYSWVGPNSFSSGNQNPSVTNAMPSATGWYKATVTLNGCFIVDSTQAVVNPIPVLSNTAANQPLCIGQTLNLSTDNISNATYNWTGPGGFNANGRTPVRANMQATHAGWYRVVASANGCVSAPDSTQTILNTPPFVVIFTAKDTICQGDAVMFTALPNSHGGTPTYAWKINGITAGVGSTFSSAAINDGDIISCNMTEYTKCGSPYIDASNDITMAVLPWLVPSVSIVANPATPVKAGQQITFTATPVNGGSVPQYQWKRNGTNTQGATSAVWSARTLSDNDEICVEMKSSYRCPQPTIVTSNCIKVKILTGIDNNTLLGSLMLYPNPNNGRFVLSGNLLKQADGTIKLEVLNTLGQVIYNSEVQMAGNSLYKEIELPHVANGTYLLCLSSHDTNQVIHFNVGN